MTDTERRCRTVLRFCGGAFYEYNGTLYRTLGPAADCAAYALPPGYGVRVKDGPERLGDFIAQRIADGACRCKGDPTPDIDIRS